MRGAKANYKESGNQCFPLPALRAFPNARLSDFGALRRAEREMVHNTLSGFQAQAIRPRQREGSPCGRVLDDAR